MSRTHRTLQPEIAKRGRDRRIALGMQVQQVAAKMMVTPTRVSQLEIDGASTIGVIERWARALRMSPGELAFGPETTPEAKP